jgi:D-glycero-alpha-D-manno-heptose-7-phosphate kinase
VPPYSDEMGGYVCNVAISRYATVTVTRGAPAPPNQEPHADQAITEAAARRFRMQGSRIEVRSDFPISAGLGGSSAVGVAAVTALAAARGEKMSPSAIAELSREIEITDLGIAGGRQDHYAAAYGGALGLRFSTGRVEVRNINLSPRTRADLERRCFVIYTGASRISADTITAVLDAYRDRDPAVLRALGAMKTLAERMSDAIDTGDVDKLATLVGEQLTHQRSLHPAIPTPRIDEIIEIARGAGALGSKALGASGGGCVLVMAARDRVNQVRDAIAPMGEMLPFTIDTTGVERCE